MEQFVAKPSCLSCRFSREYQYRPSRCRSTVKHQCKIWGFDVDAGTIPGKTVACDRFATPELPFAFETSDVRPKPVRELPGAGDVMPAHLL